MPLFDFVCKSCQHPFETLVRGSQAPVCPECGSTQLEKLLSIPYAKTESTKAQSMAAAKRRDKAAGTERTVAQREYEQSHDD